VEERVGESAERGTRTTVKRGEAGEYGFPGFPYPGSHADAVAHQPSPPF
jgi:hypothetical protein